ncbi:DUF695 domain-containing protein [Mucilaginibacter sp. ZT4R22]|uniref:DUF695 domain-containing protein n=1 Tax=Mucilaginibacter pankratovii TaxID=2772110 RepID=A0ABR7WRW6_9SPHI|nr:DUF695 domain-containing protein [Mucilaginibacter pankratovii]MBD1365051.1 DUF695 domain-containing protein [Mucilaginibacter pankratovii]
MSFLKKLFSKKEQPIKSYDNFWDWFVANEKDFFTAVKHGKYIESEFFDKLSPKLAELKDGFFFLTGMLDDNTAELVLTADGNIKNIAFVEELVSEAPKIEGWKFTALKPALDIKDVTISMAGYKFASDNLFFYADEVIGYPDEIHIRVIHSDFNESNKAEITNGTYIFLDNMLGELNFATTIDDLKIMGKNDAEKELIPIEKLKSYLIWREKEFIEKYEGIRRDTENDNYSSFKAELPNGNPMIAIINADLLNWDSKASHPWILNIEIKYDGKNNNGMPDEATYQLLDQIEDEITSELKDLDGYLNIGRETADSVREIYFACKDFRKPSKVMHAIQQKYAHRLAIDFDTYKDKYWQSLNRFLA